MSCAARDPLVTKLRVRSAEREIQELLEFRCCAPLRTVYRQLAEANGLALLADPLMERATAEIVAGACRRPSRSVCLFALVTSLSASACAGYL